MSRLNCYSARVLDTGMGLFLLIVGFFLVASGLTFLPLLGFVLAVPALGLSIFFLFAPRDETCFMS